MDKTDLVKGAEKAASNMAASGPKPEGKVSESQRRMLKQLDFKKMLGSKDK